MESVFEFVDNIINSLEAHIEIVKVFACALGAIGVMCFKDIRALVIFIVRNIFYIVFYPLRLGRRIMRNRRYVDAIETQFVELPVRTQNFLLRFVKEGQYITFRENIIIYELDINILTNLDWIERISTYPQTFAINLRVLKALRHITYYKQ